MYFWNQIVFEKEDPLELILNIRDILLVLGRDTYDAVDVEISDKNYSIIANVKVGGLDDAQPLVAKIEIFESSY